MANHSSTSPNAYNKIQKETMNASEFPITLTLASAIILVNVAEIILIFKARKNCSLFQRLLLSLAVADLLVGLSQLTLPIALPDAKMKQYKLDGILCFTIAASVNHANAITGDRFLAICWPLKHRYLISRKRILIIIAVTWCISFVMLTPRLIGDNFNHVRYIFSIATFAYSCAMIFVYTFIIYRVVVIRRKGISKTAKGITNATQASKDAQLVVVSVTLTTTFLLCTIPFCVFTFITESIPPPAKYLLLFNSLCNPIVYFFWKFLQSKSKTLKPTMSQKQVTRSA